MSQTGSDSPPDRWLVLRVPLPEAESVRDLWIEELLALEVRGVEEQAEHLVVYLPPPSQDPDALVSDLTSRLARVDAGGAAVPGPIEVGWQPHEAWEERWKQGFSARRVTDRITVAPSWDLPEVDPGEILLTLDPGMAFGTSEHPTTRGCLRLLDGLVEPGQCIADIGAGSGILGIAAALLGADRVLALELDPWACRVARENAERNGVADRISVRAGVVTTDGLPTDAPFDGIVANIESGILRPLLSALQGALTPEGWLILSGILRTEAPGIVTAAREAGLYLDTVDEEAEWWTGAFTLSD